MALSAIKFLEYTLFCRFFLSQPYKDLHVRLFSEIYFPKIYLPTVNFSGIGIELNCFSV